MTQANLTQMSLVARLRLMESLWESLRPVDDAVPAWHREVMAARAQRIDSGQEPLTEWSVAKERIRRQVAQ